MTHVPEKSPPFPCRDSYIIDPTVSVVIDHCTNNTFMVLSLDQALQLCANKDKAILLVDEALYEEILREHEQHIDTIIVATLNEIFDGDKKFNRNLLMNWFPIPKMILPAETKNPPFTIVEHRYNPMFQ